MSHEISGIGSGLVAVDFELFGKEAIVKFDSTLLTIMPKINEVEAPDVRINPNYHTHHVSHRRPQLEHKPPQRERPKHGSVAKGPVRVGFLKSEIDRAYEEDQ